MQDDHDRGVFETLPGHEGLVTGVRFTSDDSFVSGDDKGVLRCWRRFGSQACLPNVIPNMSDEELIVCSGC
jgi:hypothetical protein